MNDIQRKNQLNEHQNQNTQEQSYESTPGLRTFAITNPGIPPIADKRLPNPVQRKLQETDHDPQAGKNVPWQSKINNSTKQVTQRQELNSIFNNGAAQLKRNSEEEQGNPAIENKTGLPDNLKAGVENLSGMSMDDVKVHSNSIKPK
jgi:hypothetical protein